MTVDTEFANGVYVPRKVFKYHCLKCGHVWNKYDGEKRCPECGKDKVRRLSEVTHA